MPKISTKKEYVRSKDIEKLLAFDVFYNQKDLFYAANKGKFIP